MKRLFLIDGSALVHRSFHAFSGRSQLTSRGQDIGMIYGFLSTLMMLCRKEHPDYLAMVFDTGAPTFRHKMFDRYKANRKPLDPAIRDQLSILYELIDLLNIPQISMDGFEADDLIGTLAVRGESAGMDVFVVSGDKDFYQLVTDRVKVYTIGKQSRVTVYDSAAVKAKIGVTPDKVIDLLGLMGDSSDNVPGIPKVGKVTAATLLERFGSLEGTLASASEVKQPKLRQNLIDFSEQARLSQQLVTIDINAPITTEPNQLTFGPMNNPDVRRKLTELEFRSILYQLDQLESQSTRTGSSERTGSSGGEDDRRDDQQIALNVEEVAEPHRNYATITDPQGLASMIKQLRSADMVSMDVETTSLDPMVAELVGMSFSIGSPYGNGDNLSYYVAANHFTDIPDDFEQFDPPYLRPNTSRNLSYILEQLTPVYSDPGIPKTGQNLKYDILTLACYDVPVEGIVFDTMIASHLLDPSARQHNLDVLAQTHLAITKIPTKRLIGSGSKQTSMMDVPLPIIAEYACEDADVALKLTRFFQPKIVESNLDKLLSQEELPLIPVLMRMEKTGVALDTDRLGEMSAEFQEEMSALIRYVHELAGHEFNLNSTQQLANVLYNELGLPPGRSTKFGYSTDTSELERLAPIHELPKQLLRYRHIAKLKSTYIDALPQLIHPITGRVHTSYTQAVTATGRLSSTDPNLQNIPIRSEEGGLIRKAFIAGEPGWLILSADYSQIELRIMAHLSGDERMIESFRRGEDIHRSTAAWMHDIPPELVTSDIRRHAKEVNFGVLYGMGSFGLATRLGISRKRAKEFIERYFANFPRVKQYIDEIHENARTTGYVETMMGRRRPMPEINSSNHNIRRNAERVATNTPIQGSAADLIKRAMILVDRMLDAEEFRARMLMQVHDELVFEVPPDEVDRLSQRLRAVMEGVWTLRVPLEVGIGYGPNWLDAHD